LEGDTTDRSPLPPLLLALVREAAPFLAPLPGFKYPNAIMKISRRNKMEAMRMRLKIDWGSKRGVEAILFPRAAPAEAFKLAVTETVVEGVEEGVEGKFEDPLASPLAPRGSQ